MNIVFMGTPDFARTSLMALLNAGHNIQAVFSQPDRPRGRGMRESFSPVKTLALERGIPVYQPETFRDGEAAGIIRDLAPELLVVVAYGRILPAEVLGIAKCGSINVHGEPPALRFSIWRKRWTPAMCCPFGKQKSENLRRPGSFLTG